MIDLNGKQIPLTDDQAIALRKEIVNDPARLGYFGKSESEIAGLLNFSPNVPNPEPPIEIAVPPMSRANFLTLFSVETWVAVRNDLVAGTFWDIVMAEDQINVSAVQVKIALGYCLSKGFISQDQFDFVMAARMQTDPAYLPFVPGPSRTEELFGEGNEIEESDVAR